MDLEEEPVWQLFGKCGAVTNVRLIRDKVTNMGKGIGYVTFASKIQLMLLFEVGWDDARWTSCSCISLCQIGNGREEEGSCQQFSRKASKRAAALVKANPSASSATLGAAKSSSTDTSVAKDAAAAKKVSKRKPNYKLNCKLNLVNFSIKVPVRSSNF